MRVLPACLAAIAAALATAALADAQSSGPAAGATGPTTGTATGTTAATTPQDPGQAFFLSALQKDTKTIAAIRAALKSGAAVVDPATQYADLTGDGKQDAIVRVHSAGAAGVIAVYVFATDGSSKGTLRVLFRSQSLYRALTEETDDHQLQIDQPKYAAGDDLCCPGSITRRRYRFSKKAHSFTRTSLETIKL